MQLTSLDLLSVDLLDSNAIGAIAYRKAGNHFVGSIIHDFEALILIVCDSERQERLFKHVKIGELRCQVIYAPLSSLWRWLIAGEQRNLVYYLLEGDIIWESGRKIRLLREEIKGFDGQMREQKLFHEFARFLNNYVNAKRYLKEGSALDAYHSVLNALHHWASIEVIERGGMPSQKVLSQVRSMDKSVYKLYEELTISAETVEQRVELVLLACEFSVMSKMADCSVLLFRILRSRNEPWSIHELFNHPELKHVQYELPLVLRKLVYRSYIKESTARKSFSNDYVRELCYSVN
ncbi:nucleotidyltransferase-like protein [Paenibacillus sp. P96]|uniref:Nucleotidyltransferase-like protein n=1 Tax=Paenibacillus zeirhizosphaerae TaxID=2987519 RepID=A0ABT9FTP0_9BACL|nr:nucleotidyltransferase-like protein [Paenibacillus sp. P96]MDP4098102.1 nucleotidyltransferase-like protein [Paenibacillus sp. P96]